MKFYTLPATLLFCIFIHLSIGRSIEKVETETKNANGETVRIIREAPYYSDLSGGDRGGDFDTKPVNLVRYIVVKEYIVRAPASFGTGYSSNVTQTEIYDTNANSNLNKLLLGYNHNNNNNNNNQNLDIYSPPQQQQQYQQQHQQQPEQYYNTNNNNNQISNSRHKFTPEPQAPHEIFQEAQNFIAQNQNQNRQIQHNSANNNGHNFIQQNQVRENSQNSYQASHQPQQSYFYNQETEQNFSPAAQSPVQNYSPAAQSPVPVANNFRANVNNEPTPLYNQPLRDVRPNYISPHQEPSRLYLPVTEQPEPVTEYSRPSTTLQNEYLPPSTTTEREQEPEKLYGAPVLNHREENHIKFVQELPPRYLPPTTTIVLKKDYLPPKNDYLPPKSDYSSPSIQTTTEALKKDYLPPKRDYLPPSSSSSFPTTTESLKKDYLPPKKDYLPPKSDYASPSIQTTTESLKKDYLPPKKDYLPPRSDFQDITTTFEPEKLYGAPSKSTTTEENIFFDLPSRPFSSSSSYSAPNNRIFSPSAPAPVLKPSPTYLPASYPEPTPQITVLKPSGTYLSVAQETSTATILRPSGTYLPVSQEPEVSSTVAPSYIPPTYLPPQSENTVAATSAPRKPNNDYLPPSHSSSKYSPVSLSSISSSFPKISPTQKSQYYAPTTSELNSQFHVKVSDNYHAPSPQPQFHNSLTSGFKNFHYTSSSYQNPNFNTNSNFGSRFPKITSPSSSTSSSSQKNDNNGYHQMQSQQQQQQQSQQQPQVNVASRSQPASSNSQSQRQSQATLSNSQPRFEVPSSTPSLLYEVPNENEEETDPLSEHSGPVENAYNAPLNVLPSYFPPQINSDISPPSQYVFVKDDKEEGSEGSSKITLGSPTGNGSRNLSGRHNNKFRRDESSASSAASASASTSQTSHSHNASPFTKIKADLTYHTSIVEVSPLE